jgi:hypothetical protein
MSQTTKQTELIAAYREYYEYADVLYYTMDAVAAILERTEKSVGATLTLTVERSPNVFSLCRMQPWCTMCMRSLWIFRFRIRSMLP